MVPKRCKHITGGCANLLFHAFHHIGKSHGEFGQRSGAPIGVKEDRLVRTIITVTYQRKLVSITHLGHLGPLSGPAGMQSEIPMESKMLVRVVLGEKAHTTPRTTTRRNLLSVYRYPSTFHNADSYALGQYSFCTTSQSSRAHFGARRDVGTIPARPRRSRVRSWPWHSKHTRRSTE
jgi:hypothetical protein